jgi:hypothetical protein
MRSVLLVGVLAACHRSGKTCTAKLDELARFYEAVAADNASATPRAGLRPAAAAVGVDKLPEATGEPADLSKADVLLVGPTDSALVTAEGEARPLHGEEFFPLAPDAKRQLVLEIDERVPWPRVEHVRQRLSAGMPYGSVAVAYRTKGALAGRAKPKVPEPIDIPAIGVALAKTAAVHCPDYAKQLAALQSGGEVGDPALLRALAATISHCDCGVDTSLIEALPWLVAEPLVTVVPFASTAPPLHGADSATWGDLVRDAKGPVPMMLPPPPAPPPPPPPPHRR